MRFSVMKVYLEFLLVFKYRPGIYQRNYILIYYKEKTIAEF